MDVSSELSRLLPRLDQVPDDAKARDFLRFLTDLNRKDYEEVLKLLPDRLTRHREAAVKDETAWEKFVDFACYQSILNYTRHVPGSQVIRLLTSKTGIGGSLSRLAQMMSPGLQKRIVIDLLAAEVKDCLAYLEEVFKGDRPGLVDFAVEEMLKVYDKERSRKIREATEGNRRWNDIDLPPSKALDERILRTIQEQRRQDPRRLPARLKTSYEVRFVAEEIHRELFGYQKPNETRAVELITRILAWYPNSELRRSILRNIAIYLIESGFFENLNDVRMKIALGASYAGHWNTYILGSLRSEKFWHDIAGLNRDIAIESTEAGMRTEVYKRAAVVGGLIFAGLLLLPVTIRVVAASPGAVVRLFRWAGSRLLLASQYAYSTYRAYGLFAGTAQLAREGYTYYLQNALTINQHMVDVTEFFFEFTTEGTGHAPGSSPADISNYTLHKIAALTGRQGIAKLASEARTVAKQADTEIELVRLTVKDSDQKFFEVFAKVTEFKEGKIKVTRLSAKELTSSEYNEARKTITFFSKPEKEAALIQDPRATLNPATDIAKAELAAERQATNAGRVQVQDKLVQDQLALRRQQIAEQKRLEAEKLAENLAQKQELLQQGERKVANAPDTVVIEMSRKRTGTGTGDKAVLGSAVPAQGGGRANVKARSTGDTGNLTADGKAIKDRANGSHLRSVPADKPSIPAGVRKSPAGYLVVEDEALLDPLKKAGFDVEAVGLKSPKSGGGRYQKYVSSSDSEWRVTSPSEVIADIDTLAVDAANPKVLVAVEAKATFVANPGKSAHLIFYPKKVEQLSRQLAICLESKGLMRLEIVGNAVPVAETYLNITAQQLARELKKNFARQVKEFLAHSTDKAVKRLSLKDVEQIVEENVTVVVAKWGRTK